MALRAYIGMRKYKNSVDVADLENQIKANFGFASIPQDSSCLTVHTFKKNPKLHRQLSNYFLVLKYEKEWKSWKDIFDSMDESLRTNSVIKSKMSVLDQLETVLEECKNDGDCKIDLRRKKISCTAKSRRLEWIDEYEGEQAQYFQYMMEEGMKLGSLAKFIDLVEMETALYKSRMKESLIPPIRAYHDNVEYDFSAVDGSFPFFNLK